MADTTFQTLRTQLDIDLRDTDNFTFTPAEKDEVLRQVIEDDPDCYTIELDTSNSITASTTSYTTPFVNTTDVGYDAYGDGYITYLRRADWEQIGDQVYLSRALINLPVGKALFLIGTAQLTKGDIIPGTHRDYVINNAVVRTLDLLLEGKVNRFLRNDTTMAELQAVRSNRMAKVAELRKKLTNRRPVRF